MLKKTEEVLPQFEFAEIFQQNGTMYCTSPAPFGGTLPKGEGFFSANYSLKFKLLVYYTPQIPLIQEKLICIPENLCYTVIR